MADFRSVQWIHTWKQQKQNPGRGHRYVKDISRCSSTCGVQFPTYRFVFRKSNVDVRTFLWISEVAVSAHAQYTSGQNHTDQCSSILETQWRHQGCGNWLCHPFYLKRYDDLFSSIVLHRHRSHLFAFPADGLSSVLANSAAKNTFSFGCHRIGHTGRSACPAHLATPLPKIAFLEKFC